jgi:RNA polymerase sigma-70 factor, ECF subfamily
MDAESEWKLILSCRAGSAAAFEPLVRRYEGRALLVASSLLGDADEAADAVQDAFVRAYRGLHRLREGSGFGPWFSVLLRNHCLDLLRSRRRGHASLTAEQLDREAWSEPAGSGAMEREQLSSAVHRALAAISPEHRQVLVLKELEGLSYAQISEATGTTAGTVASRLHHARAALKKVLVSRGISLTEGG